MLATVPVATNLFDVVAGFLFVVVVVLPVFVVPVVVPVDPLPALSNMISFSAIINFEN